MKRGLAIFGLLVLFVIIISGCKSKELSGNTSETLNEITGNVFGIDKTDYTYTISTGTLIANSNPKGYLFVNGELKCTPSLSCITPQTLSLIPGSYEITITKPGYKDYLVTKTILASQTTTVNAILKKKAISGRITFTSNPIPAKIYIDKVYKGVTPKIVTEVGFGTHTVKVEKLCYGSYVDTITMTQAAAEQGSLFVNAVLPLLGTVNTNSNPPGAKLYIDGTLKGYTPKNVCGLGSGLHEILVKKIGYADYVANVNIYSGQSLSLDVNLVPS